jgi:hypothetical protein
MASDALEDAGRPAEAERFRATGRCIVRWIEGHYSIDPKPEPLTTYCGRFFPSGTRRDASTITVDAEVRGHLRVEIFCHHHYSAAIHTTNNVCWGRRGVLSARLADVIIRHCTDEATAVMQAEPYARAYLRKLDVDAWRLDEEVLLMRLDALEYIRRLDADRIAPPG